MINRFLEGNTNPGKGNGSLSGDIRYLRGQNGGRVFFRIVGETMEILGKSSKANEQRVIDLVEMLFGGD